jgi:hypothetical protein
MAGRPSRPIAGDPGYGGGYDRRGYRAAAVAAHGAYGYYGNNGCYDDNYGQLICPLQYPYQY